MLLVLGFVVSILAVICLLKFYLNQNEQGRKRFWRWSTFALIFVGVVYLTLTGRLHFIAVAVTALLPFIRKLLILSKSAKAESQERIEEESSKSFDQGQNQKKMEAEFSDLLDAYRVLGLKQTASREEVIEAHKKLIQKLHPDLGGNDYLAAHINSAKDQILAEMEEKEQGR